MESGLYSTACVFVCMCVCVCVCVCMHALARREEVKGDENDAPILRVTIPRLPYRELTRLRVQSQSVSVTKASRSA